MRFEHEVRRSSSASSRALGTANSIKPVTLYHVERLLRVCSNAEPLSDEEVATKLRLVKKDASQPFSGKNMTGEARKVVPHVILIYSTKGVRDLLHSLPQADFASSSLRAAQKESRGGRS